MRCASEKVYPTSKQTNYILTHGVSGVDWRFKKHPLAENVYNVLMNCWNDVKLAKLDFLGLSKIEASKQPRIKHVQTVQFQLWIQGRLCYN